MITSTLRNVLVTRIEPGASRTASKLRQAAWSPIVSPVLKLEPVSFDPAIISSATVLAVTSSAAVEALANAGVAGGGMPVFCVGDQTAARARSFGFSRVTSAAGDVGDLAQLISEKCASHDKVLHVAGKDVAGDLVGAVMKYGILAERLVVYETVMADAFSPEAVACMRAGNMHAVLLYSPRGAEAFSRIMANIDWQLHGGVMTIRYITLSSAVADRVTLPNADISVASAPNEASLFDCLWRSGG